MRYLSIDLETTGLDPTRHQILSMAAILDDTDPAVCGELKDRPRFQAYIKWEELVGHPVALAMNKELIQQINKMEVGYFNKPRESDMVVVIDGTGNYTLADYFQQWLSENGFTFTYDGRVEQQIVVAGKVFARFDWNFLERVPEFAETFMATDNMRSGFHKRVLDPTMFYLRPEDSVPPDTAECYHRANIPFKKGHDAMEDAEGVCLLIRHAMKFYGVK